MKIRPVGVDVTKLIAAFRNSAKTANNYTKLLHPASRLIVIIIYFYFYYEALLAPPSFSATILIKPNVIHY
jgi:hypothetical protein